MGPELQLPVRSQRGGIPVRRAPVGADRRDQRCHEQRNYYGGLVDVITCSWIDARRERPRDGELVLAAVTGRYPASPDEAPSSEQDFWLVLPMHFRQVHPIEGTMPFGSGSGDEEVTHWSALLALPGTLVDELTGASVALALVVATSTA